MLIATNYCLLNYKRKVFKFIKIFIERNFVFVVSLQSLNLHLFMMTIECSQKEVRSNWFHENIVNNNYLALWTLHRLGIHQILIHEKIKTRTKTLRNADENVLGPLTYLENKIRLSLSFIWAQRCGFTCFSRSDVFALRYN